MDAIFRRRPNEEENRYGGAQGLTFADDEKRMFPLIAISALFATMSLATLTGCTSAFSMMGLFASAAETLRAFMSASRADIDYHGIMVSWYQGSLFITIQSAMDNMKLELKQLYDVIHVRTCAEYESHLPSLLPKTVSYEFIERIVAIPRINLTNSLAIAVMTT